MRNEAGNPSEEVYIYNLRQRKGGLVKRRAIMEFTEEYLALTKSLMDYELKC